VPTLLYGLTLPNDPRPAGIIGPGGGACRVLDCGAVGAIVASVTAAPDATITAVHAHDGVLREFVRQGATVAAVRFGQSFEDDEACVREVQRRSARVAALLAEHAGCVEMRVLLPVEAVPVPPRSRTTGAGPGQAYLQALRDRGDVAPNVSLRPLIGPTVRAERVEGFQAREGGVRGIAFAHLVHRQDLGGYRDGVRAIPSLGDARVVGPLPLYSFAEPAP
jgi:hypothetical protein